MGVRIAGIALLLVLYSACGLSGIRGETNQWVKGNRFSVNVSFTNHGPMIQVRNDSGAEASIVPVRVTGWFKSAGRLESSSVFGEFGEGSGLISGSFSVVAADGSRREASVDAKNPELRLNPNETVTLSPSLWSFKTGAFDPLERLQIFVAGDTREVFVIE